MGSLPGGDEPSPFTGDYDINIFTRDHSDQWSLAYEAAKSLHTGAETIGIYGDDDTTSVGAEVNIDHGWTIRVTFAKEPDTVGVVESPILLLQSRGSVGLNLRLDGITGVAMDCINATDYNCHIYLKNGAGISSVDNPYQTYVDALVLEQEAGDSSTVTLGSFNFNPASADSGADGATGASADGIPGTDGSSVGETGGNGDPGGSGGAGGNGSNGSNATIIPTHLTLIGVTNFAVTDVFLRPQEGGSGGNGGEGGSAHGGVGGKGGPGDESNPSGSGGSGGNGGTGGNGGNGGDAGASLGAALEFAPEYLVATGPVAISNFYRANSPINGGQGGYAGQANGGIGGPPGDDGGAGVGSVGADGSVGITEATGASGADSPATYSKATLSGGASILNTY